MLDADKESNNFRYSLALSLQRAFKIFPSSVITLAVVFNISSSFTHFVNSLSSQISVSLFAIRHINFGPLDTRLQKHMAMPTEMYF